MAYHAKTHYRCGKCGRTTDEDHVRGWLIDTHKDAAKAFNGEMVIRCPNHITNHAIRCAEHGRAAIRQ